jgi:hypothetical protein
MVVASGLPSASLAVEGTASYGVGVGTTDNIARVPTDEDSDTLYIANLYLDLLDEDGRLHSDVDAQLEYVDYASGTFDSEVTGLLNAYFELSIVPGRFYWLLRENFGQRQQDPFTASTPANREYVNFLTTGPQVDLVNSARNVIRAQLVYSRVDFEESLSDNERFGGALQFGREVSRGHILSLIGSTESVEFADDAVGTDYDRNQAYIRYEGLGGNNEIEIDVGYTEIDADGEKFDEVLFRLDWNRQISTYSSWRLLGGSEISDEGSVFRLFQEELGDLNVTSNAFNNPNPFLNHYVTTNFSYVRDRSETSLVLALNQADFEDNNGSDRDTIRVGFRLRRDIGDRFFGGLRLEARFTEFSDIDRKTDSFSGVLTLGYRIGGYTDLSLQYQYTTRNDTVSLNEYDENRFFLRASYTPGWAR